MRILSTLFVLFLTACSGQIGGGRHSVGDIDAGDSSTGGDGSVAGDGAGAHEALLSWTAPTTNADLTPLTDLAGFKVYWGSASGSYDNSLDVGNVTSHSLTSADLGSAQRVYFVVTAYDTSGNESVYSQEVFKDF